MPVYDYECSGCGIFTALRPMSQHAAPMDCPVCGIGAPRVLISAPALAGMDAGRRRAFAVNERSAHAPTLSSAHGSGCSCCKPGTAIGNRGKLGGAKSFPQARPWMISH